MIFGVLAQLGGGRRLRARAAGGWPALGLCPVPPPNFLPSLPNPCLCPLHCSESRRALPWPAVASDWWRLVPTPWMLVLHPVWMASYSPWVAPTASLFEPGMGRRQPQHRPALR
jgi:hypothetical protein